MAPHEQLNSKTMSDTINDKLSTEDSGAVGKPAVGGSAFEPVSKAVRYKDWMLLECLPKGWMIDKTAGSPLYGYEFCTDGKSVIHGQKRALVRVARQHVPVIEYVQTKENKRIGTVCNAVKGNSFPSQTVNILARKKFQEHLLKDIQFDLMVCEIEGWDKREYINEIKKLLNGIDTSNKKVKAKSIPDLFGVVCI